MHLTFATDDGIGWLDFIASLIGSLAWPLVILALAILYRGPITYVLKNLREAKWGGNSVTIGMQIDEAEEAAREVEAVVPSEAVDTTPINAHEEQEELSTQKNRMLAQEPGLMVLQQWAMIESKLAEISAPHFRLDEQHRPANAMRITRELARRGLIPSEVVDLIGELRHIRNSVAHGQYATVSRLDALRFVELSQRVQQLLAAVE